MLEDVRALLIDLDGVLYVEEQPIAGAEMAVRRLRERGLALRFVTNTTAHSRDRTLEKLARLGLGVDDHELVTPAALAVGYCRERGHQRVALIMNEEVKRDFKELKETTGRVDAVIIGDLGSAFGYDVLNHAFRQVIDGAELIALQKNRYWMRADGLSLDVGPFVAAIEFAADLDAYIVGNPPEGSSSRCSSPPVWMRAPQRWSATTLNRTSAEHSAPGSTRSSCGLASTAKIACANPESNQPASSTRSPTCPRCWAAENTRGPSFAEIGSRLDIKAQSEAAQPPRIGACSRSAAPMRRRELLLRCEAAVGLG
jgi:phospholysine phosphohistidine inorganic pyrophosphate phosphatase